MEDKKRVECRLAGKLRLEEKRATNPVVVGDFVEITINEDQTGTIHSVKPRKNKITRQATHGKKEEHILAANVDQAFTINAIKKPAYKEGFIDRFLVTCEAYGVLPVIVINKIDLADGDEIQEIEALTQMYNDIGYRVIATSIHKKPTLEKLNEQLAESTSVFVGPSGTGKTSLLNAMGEELDLPTKSISDYSNKGKHTTTYSQLVALSNGGYIVDTPGIREFGLVDFEPGELASYFPEMVELSEQCKFYNCTHSHEPGCGVMEAFDKGQISASRYQSYLQILESLEESERNKY